MKFNEWTPRLGYLPALSIRQPWCWLILNCGKDVENRDWKTNYRGPLLIHAGKQMDKDFPWGQLDTPDRNMPLTKDYPLGGIVGIATLVDVVTSSTSPWFSGRYGFVLRDVQALPFMPYSGALGLFPVRDVAAEGEIAVRARNIPLRDLDHAYDLTQAIAKAEAAKQTPRERPVFGDPRWIERTRQKPTPGRCIIEVNGERI